MVCEREKKDVIEKVKVKSERIKILEEKCESEQKETIKLKRWNTKLENKIEEMKKQC